MMLPVAILAGGTASRLWPISEKIPKSLVEVAGRPFVFHQLEWLQGEGVKSVIFCVGHLGKLIVDAVGNGSAFGISVEYSFDGERLLGTGGALKKSISRLGDAFFVLYGDSFLRCSLAEVQTAYYRSGKPALMTVLKNGGQWDKSNVNFRDGKLVRHDKVNPDSEMHYIDYGLSVIRSDVLTDYALGEPFDLSDVFAALANDGKLAGYEVGERFYEIGSHSGLKETEAFLLRKDNQ